MSHYDGIVVLHHRLIRKLGEGGFGSVFLAEHESAGRKAAVKILHPVFARDNALVQRFFGEMKAVGPSAVIDKENSGYLESGEPFYLIEFFAGMTTEQTEGADERADVYALGATIFNALAGRPPFVNQNSTEILPQCDAPSLRRFASWVPSGLDEVIARCLSAKVEERPASIALAWEAIATACPNRALADCEVPSIRKSGKPWLWAAAALLGAASVGMALALSDGTSTDGADAGSLVQAAWDAGPATPDAAVAVVDTPPVKRSTDPRCSVHNYLQRDNGIDSAEKAAAKLADFEVCLEEGQINDGQFVGLRESLIRDIGKFNRERRARGRAR